MVKYMNKSVRFESLETDGFRVDFKWVPVYLRVLLERQDGKDKLILFFLFGQG